MIIIHAAQLAGQLTLWAEDTGQPSHSDHAPDGRHPRCADATRLMEAIGDTTVELDAPQAEATIGLPSCGNNPIPSEALAGPASKSIAKPSIRPWRVPMVRLSSTPGHRPAATLPRRTHADARHGALDEPALPDYTRTAKLLILKWTTAKRRSNTGCT